MCWQNPCSRLSATKMGSLFSAHPTHFRPPSTRRHSRRRKRIMSAVSSASAGAVNMATQVVTVAGNDQDKLSTDYPHHRPVSQSGSSASDRSCGQVTSQTSAAKQRKPSLKVTMKKIYSSTTTTSPNDFTDDRRQLVFVSWQEITDKVGKFETAKLIFQNLFRESPAIRAMFGVATEDFDVDTCFSVARHIQVFGNVLDLAVRNVLELEAEIGPLLVMFGRRHFHKHQVDFQNEYLIHFGQSIAEVVYANMSEGFGNNPETTIGWRLFISYLIKKIKEGYDLEVLQTKK